MENADVLLELDACGLLCPLPVLKLRKALQGLPGGARVRMVADDPAAMIDVPHFCQEQGHMFEGETSLEGGRTAYVVRKTA